MSKQARSDSEVRSVTVTLVAETGNTRSLPDHDTQMSLETYAETVERWLRENDPFPDIVQQTCPDGVFARIIKAAFFASLAVEEGRPCRAKLILRLDSFYIKDVLCFAEPLPLDPASIAKLSPACQNPNRALVVTLGNNHLPMISEVGNLLQDRHPSEFGRVNAGGSSTGSPLVVEILDPGHIRVLGFAQSTQYVRGTFQVLPRLPQRGWDTLFNLLSSDHSVPVQNKSPVKVEWKTHLIQRCFRAWIVTVLRHAIALRQGGTLIFTPKRTMKSHVGIQVKYPANIASLTIIPTLKLIEQMVTASSKSPTDIGEVESRRSVLFDHARAVAEMAAVDGCVVIGKNATILGFGAKLFPRRPRGLNAAQSPTMGKLTAIEQIGGMRHQSAARHVLARKSDMAFVISQDGGVTAFWWDPEYPDRPTMHKDIAIPLQDGRVELC